MKQLLNLMTIGSLLLFGAACSTQEKQQDQQLTQKVNKQMSANTPEEILERAAAKFSSAEGLNSTQKDKLAGIYVKVYVESMQLRSEIGRSKSLIFEMLATPNYKASDLNKLKDRVVDLDQKRLTVMFNALDEVRSVVGTGAGKENIYKHFEKYEMPDRSE